MAVRSVVSRGYGGWQQALAWGLTGILAWSAGPARAEEPGAVDAVPGPLGGAEMVGQVTLSLAIVVAALLAVAWLLRRAHRLQAGGGVNLRIVGVLPLGARERILIVEAGSTRLLVGASPGGGLRTLHVFEGTALSGAWSAYEAKERA